MPLVSETFLVQIVLKKYHIPIKDDLGTSRWMSNNSAQQDSREWTGISPIT